MDVYILLIGAAVLIWFLGHSFIDSYFEQKAELLEKFLEEEDM